MDEGDGVEATNETPKAPQRYWWLVLVVVPVVIAVMPVLKGCLAQKGEGGGATSSGSNSPAISNPKEEVHIEYK